MPKGHNLFKIYIASLAAITCCLKHWNRMKTSCARIASGGGIGMNDHHQDIPLPLQNPGK
jgi:hypothetical protein